MHYTHSMAWSEAFTFGNKPQQTPQFSFNGSQQTPQFPVNGRCGAHSMTFEGLPCSTAGPNSFAGAFGSWHQEKDPVLSADCYCDAEDSGEFMLLADVKLVVQGGQELPAHSHILAVHSRVLLNLISGLDTPPTPANPFVLKEACAAWPLDDVLLLLKHAYKRSKFATEREAWRLLDIADFFDAGALLNQAKEHLEALCMTDFRGLTPESVGDLLLKAERLQMPCTRRRCLEFMWHRFRAMSAQTLSRETLMALLDHAQAKSSLGPHQCGLFGSPGNR